IKEGLSGIRYYFRNVASIQIIDAIHTEVKQMEADLLIMVPYKYGFWDSLVHRSKTRVMASESSVPLLSLPL
ncbi:MAG: universal stress protein, partial [Xanthomarina gelatinilytica]